MKSKTLLFIAILTALIFTGCQNNDLSAENQSLKQQITEMEQQITELEQQLSKITDINTSQNINDSASSLSDNTMPNTNTDSITTAYTLEELASMVDEFTVSVGSATPDVTNSGNLDQFFSLKREADQIDHALENYENSLEDQDRAGTISREEYKTLDRDIEKLEELLDSTFDRLEIAYGIDD